MNVINTRVQIPKKATCERCGKVFYSSSNDSCDPAETLVQLLERKPVLCPSCI